MKKYKVNIQIITNIETMEEEICLLFHDIIYYLDDRLINNNKYWILDFELNEDMNFEEQTNIILSHLDKELLDTFIKKGSKFILDIQVYYNTVTCTINLSSKFLQNLVLVSENIEINYSIYPTDFQETKT